MALIRSKSQQLFTFRNIVFIAVLLAAVFICNDIISKRKTHSGGKQVATKESLPVKAESPNSVVDAEKWNSFLSMGIVPLAVRHLFAYSETEAARLGELADDHPDVIEYIRKHKLLPAPPLASQTKDPPKDMSTGQSEMGIMLSKNMTGGFYVECGAFDGKTVSVTFLAERKLNWSGMLIEAEPSNLESTLYKRRNAIVVPACLSLSTKPKLSSFNVGKQMQGKIVQEANAPGTVKVQCLPLYSILLAANRTTVDLFSLDVEGNEVDVLKTIPFDKVNIKMLIVEHYNIKEGKKGLESFMESKGYVTIPSKPEEQKDNRWGFWDCIFVKKGSGFKEKRD